MCERAEMLATTFRAIYFSFVAMARRPSPDRERTDESLRVERERADRALGDALAALDETADAVIKLARERADKLLASARAKADRAPAAPGGPSRNIIERGRAGEDGVLRDERRKADESVHVKRVARAVAFPIGRTETDGDLVSERARADDALATRDEFLGVVSHDLRSMLNNVVGFAGLIASDVVREDGVEQVRRHAERIQRSGMRMNRLIGDLVDVASIEAGVLRVTREVGDPTPVVTEAVDSFRAQASAAGLSLKTALASPSSLVAFEAARILQVLANLLGNAIKFTPAGGNILVRVQRLRDDMLFSVSDTGVGIPPDRLEAIFERFVQVTKNDRRGVGLGLYISKCIVQGHGGRIWAESTVGKGSTFFFSLPIHDAATQ